MSSDLNEAILKTIGRWGLILLVIFLLLILSSLPLNVFNIGSVRPAFMLMAVYYLAILRPSIIPALVVFIIGITLDLISSYPIGLNALTLVAVQWIIKSQRRFLAGQQFKVLWGGFTLICFAVNTLHWGIFSLFNFNAFSFIPTIISVLLSSFLFPLVALPLSQVNKALSDE